MAKSNIDYLRELIADNNEAIEFLDAIETEVKELEKEVTDLEDELSTKADESELEAANDRIEELETENSKLSPTHEFAGIDRVYVQANNLSDAQKIEDVLSHIFKRI